MSLLAANRPESQTAAMKLPPVHRPLAGLILFTAFVCPLPAAGPAAEAEQEIYTLPKIEVSTQLTCSFGIGIIGTWDAKAQRIGRLFINEVAEGSTAARLGLQRGDEILSINGRKIAEMKGGNKPGSDLFALLVNRPPNEEIEVEVAVRVLKKVILPAAKLGAPGPLKPAAQMTPVRS